MASNFDDLLQCPICLDILHDPKVLDCQHTFCANCLKAHHTTTARTFGATNYLDCKFSTRSLCLIIIYIQQVRHVVYGPI